LDDKEKVRTDLLSFTKNYWSTKLKRVFVAMEHSDDGYKHGHICMEYATRQTAIGVVHFANQLKTHMMSTWRKDPEETRSYNTCAHYCPKSEPRAGLSVFHTVLVKYVTDPSKSKEVDKNATDGSYPVGLAESTYSKFNDSYTTFLKGNPNDKWRYLAYQLPGLEKQGILCHWQKELDKIRKQDTYDCGNGWIWKKEISDLTQKSIDKMSAHDFKK
jgi:hypothetical protein